MYQYVGIAQVVPRGLMQDSLEPRLNFDEFDDLTLFYTPPFYFTLRPHCSFSAYMNYLLRFL